MTRRPLQLRLDLHTGVPVYRQIIDQVLLGIASGTLQGGDQLPTVRQLAVDLAINPNTVVRAYRNGHRAFFSGRDHGFGRHAGHVRFGEIPMNLIPRPDWRTMPPPALTQ